MTEWKRDRADYKFLVSGFEEDTIISVTGVMDPSENNRPKLIIEDHFDNRGPSALLSPAREQCLQSLSDSMKIEPQDADWYSRGKDGKLQALSIHYEKGPNPKFEAWKNSGEFNIHEEGNARKYFPDVQVLKVTPRDLTQIQEKNLYDAFGGAEYLQKKNRDASKVEVGQKSAHEYDLHQEQIHRM